jgi:transcriptional regulator with XRE-family HTH domain
MYEKKAPDGSHNQCRNQIIKKRMDNGMSQRQLAVKLQCLGMNVGKNTIQRIESGERYVADFELVYIAQALGVEISELLMPIEEITTIL